MSGYKALNKQVLEVGKYKIVPIRFEDRYAIMKWRNEQIYHLRQSKPLTENDQNSYFESIVSSLFNQEKPNQILFSLLFEDKCVGYGGLVHINWIDFHAEVSFIMDTALEKRQFDQLWTVFLYLLEQVAFNDLRLHKLNTYAFDLRPHLYKVLEKNLFAEEARLKEHCFFDGQFKDVVLHGKINDHLVLKRAQLADLEITYQWAKDPIVRKYAFQKKHINFEEHELWFKKQLEDSRSIFFILKKGLRSLGSFRLNLDEQDIGIISYLIDPTYHSQNLGAKILYMAIRELQVNYPEISRIKGYVIPENKASVRIFEKLHFACIELNENKMAFELILKT
jgi:RimJ/RimL family protein N-acetyltransferase